jgi:hypothetical protein
MSDFRTLKLAVELYELTESLEINGHLRDQLSRADLPLPSISRKEMLRPRKKRKSATTKRRMQVARSVRRFYS